MRGGATFVERALTRARFDGQYRNTVAGIISQWPDTGDRGYPWPVIDADVYALSSMGDADDAFV